MLDIIIITHNAKSYLRRCLQSITEKVKGIDYRIIVVDNGSADGTREMILNEFPDIVLIANRYNKGVAPARNQGIRVSRSKYLLLLDADTETTEHAIETLLEFMESHPSIGVVGPKLVSHAGILQYSCRRFPRLITTIYRRLDFLPFVAHSQILREHHMSGWNHGYPQPVDYIIGACQAIRRKALVDVGLLDEKIFYGPEDIDFCLRMWLKHWQVYYYPRAVVIHHEQRMTKRNPFSIVALRHCTALGYLFTKYRFNLTKHLPQRRLT